jgi:hypothetical protein
MRSTKRTSGKLASDETSRPRIVSLSQRAIPNTPVCRPHPETRIGKSKDRS